MSEANVSQPKDPTPGRPEEHALLAVPRRDVFVTLLLAVATLVFFALMANHATMHFVLRIDDAFRRRMVSIQTGWLTSAAKVLNTLGMIYVTLPVRLAIAGFLAFRRRWWHFAAFVAAIVLAEISIGTLKALYHRARPPGPLVPTTAGSFPSGHAVAAAVTTVAAVIALFPEGPRRFAWGALAVAFSLVMALSRAYLRAHWLSDAVGGVLLGTSIALGTAVVVHLIRMRRAAAARTVHQGPLG